VCRRARSRVVGAHAIDTVSWLVVCALITHALPQRAGRQSYGGSHHPRPQWWGPPACARSHVNVVNVVIRIGHVNVEAITHAPMPEGPVRVAMSSLLPTH